MSGLCAVDDKRKESCYNATERQASLTPRKSENMKTKKKGFLHRFGEGGEGDAAGGSVPTPQTERETGEAIQVTPPAAGEEATAQTREEAFKALMEGEYKDLFTAYFQETFNRRFREQKTMQQELCEARRVISEAAELLGLGEGEDVIAAIRAENERKSAPTASAAEMPEAKAPPPAPAITEEELRLAVCKAAENARLETERAVLDGIRARGIRPVENALSPRQGNALRGDASRLSRAQRAEVARRAALGEQIKF